MKLFLHKTLFLLLLTLIGCSTTNKQKDQRLVDLFTTPNPQENTYTLERVESDQAVLSSLKLELDSLSSEIAKLKRELEFNEAGYLSEQQNKQIEFLLFRIINAYDISAEIISFYKNNKGIDLDTHTKGAIIGMYANICGNYYGSYFCALFHDKPDLIKILNIPHPRYQIKKDSFDFIYKQVTSPENIELIDLSWYLFSKEINNPNSALSQVKKTHKKYAKLMDEIDLLHASTHIQIRYILQSNSHTLPHLENRLRHSQLNKLTQQAEDAIGENLYQARGFVFKNVARIKNPEAEVLQFSADQIDHIKEKLQAGDIILTYSAGYMSNVFLPGNFKHGITYIGSPSQRKNAGLTETFIKENSISESQAERLIKQVNIAKNKHNEDQDIIEAVAEGVILNSLDEILETHINRLVIIRPNLTAEERQKQLLTLFKYLDAAYDFRFDFQDDSYQCCTELIYRSLQAKGEIDFSLVKMKGRWILAADDILNYYLTQNPQSFEFVLLVDKSAMKKHRAQIIEGEPGLQALHELMDIQAQ